MRPKVAGQNQDFFAVREDWSRRKHLILEHYLLPATAKLRKASRDGRVFILDGFAGPGQYEDGSPGSPVNMGRLADKVRSWSNPVDLRIVNIEPKPKNYASLELHTQEWAQQGVISNRKSKFSQALPGILVESGSSPLVAFLDPFKPKHLKFADIAPLLTRKAITELFIVFHTPRVRRIIRAIDSPNTKAQTKSAMIQQLNEVFGGEHWQSLLGWVHRDEDVLKCFLDGLAVLCRSSHTNFYMCATPIEARYGIDLKYHIVFATRHPDGIRLMNDVFATERRDVHGQTEDHTLPMFEEFANPLEPSQWVSGARRLLLKAASDLPANEFSFKELLLRAIHLEPGQFKQTDFRRAARELLATTQKTKFVGIEGSKLTNGQWKVEDGLVLRLDE